MLISTRCVHGFMSNLIKKSWTDSILQLHTVSLAHSSKLLGALCWNTPYHSLMFLINRQEILSVQGKSSTIFDTNILRLLYCVCSLHYLNKYFSMVLISLKDQNMFCTIMTNWKSKKVKYIFLVFLICRCFFNLKKNRWQNIRNGINELVH